MNIMYIRAAIQARTGIKLTLPQVKQYLLEEGLLTPSKARNIIFPGYSGYYPRENNWHHVNTTILPVDQIIKD